MTRRGLATGPDQKFPHDGLFRAKPALFKTIQLENFGGNFISISYRRFRVKKLTFLCLYNFKLLNQG